MTVHMEGPAKQSINLSHLPAAALRDAPESTKQFVLDSIRRFFTGVARRTINVCVCTGYNAVWSGLRECNEHDTQCSVVIVTYLLDSRRRTFPVPRSPCS